MDTATGPTTRDTETTVRAEAPTLARRRWSSPGRVLVASAVLAATVAATVGAVAALTPDPVGREDGRIPDGEPVSADDDHPAIAGLDPALLAAVRRAAADASGDGVLLRVTSGWRSTPYQQQLLDDAVAARGSAEARRWVSTPEDSRHVTGDAVDIGPTDAAAWLVRQGSRYGLCQVYANEMWHFELLAPPGGRCPALQADAAG